MNISKLRFFALGVSVITLGVVIGTFLWLKFTPRHGYQTSEAKPLDSLGRYGSVPDFSLTERSGKISTRADLLGKIWIADFIYTTCQDTCPLQSAAMARLQEEMTGQEKLKLVSFSVDPQHDTPQVLSRYAARFKAEGDRWFFFTGTREQISRLVQEGFRLSAAPLKEASTKNPVILHSPRFVLVDGRAQIRGYYDSREPDSLRRLKMDAMTLLDGTKE
jgi:protein SCO1/2